MLNLVLSQPSHNAVAKYSALLGGKSPQKFINGGSHYDSTYSHLQVIGEA
jgi:hypothetical protein